MRVGDPIPESLASCLVFDRSGKQIPVSSLWAKGPTLLVFLRHFGCLCCSEQVTSLAPRLEELDELGIRTVFVGNGEPHLIERFIERFALGGKKVTIVTDPNLAAYRAAGLLRSFWAAYGFAAIRDMIRATGQGHITRMGEGNALQQGGTLLIDEDGHMAWYFRNRSKGGHAQTVEIIDAAMKLALRQARQTS